MLDTDVRNKIAAGEVIQNPRSVVKELLENALDAGAGRVEVEIRQGGKEKISASDDGCGMERDDVLLAVARYATSKISKIEDLSRIMTYGFRGEALASIGIVARLSVETRARHQDVGTRVLIEAGEMKETVDWGRDFGTVVTVHDLFFNLPVRRRFLKSAEYEKRNVVDLVRSYVVANPQVGFKLTSDGKVLLQFEPVPDYAARIKQVFGRTYAKLFALDEKGEPLQVTGFLSRPGDETIEDGFQYIIINGRPVQHRAVYRAVVEALGRPQHKPSFCVYIQSDPGFLDVNIHPAKTEVKFKDERYAQDFIFQAIKRQLAKTTQPTVTVSEGLFPYGIEADRERGEEFWQLHNTYIVAPTRTGMIIVDQHVAHERIIFESILKAKPALQRLLFPVIIELEPPAFEAYQRIKVHLGEMGMETKEFSGNVVVIDTLPAGTKANRDELKNLFAEVSGMKTELVRKREEIAKVIACKTAIKAGDRLTPAEMQNLIDRLFACANPYICPHGRPTVIKFSLDELGHRFGRT